MTHKSNTQIKPYIAAYLLQHDDICIQAFVIWRGHCLGYNITACVTKKTVDIFIVLLRPSTAQASGQAQLNVEGSL